MSSHSAAGIRKLKIRSSLTLRVGHNGICARLRRDSPVQEVNHGEAVGVIAAQSIGRPAPS